MTNTGCLLIGAGVAFLLAGFALSGPHAVPPIVWNGFSLAAALTGAVAASLLTLRSLRGWKHAYRAQAAVSRASEDAAPLIMELQSDYYPYVQQAARKLGQAQDASAVPSLTLVLERCIDEQRPGWCEVASEVAEALALIGDRRALPVLQRLENVRGIGLIPSIRSAIARIEPRTSLLRAGGVDDHVPGVLLRAAGTGTDCENALLLVSADEP